MIDEIEKLEAIAKKSPDEPGAWPFYMASFNKLATPTAVLSLIDRLKKAESELAAMREQKPVTYLRFRAAQQWSGIGGHDIEHAEWFETCNAHEIGDDKEPAFPVYASPIAAPEPATQPMSDTEILKRAREIQERDGDLIWELQKDAAQAKFEEFISSTKSAQDIQEKQGALIRQDLATVMAVVDTFEPEAQEAFYNLRAFIISNLHMVSIVSNLPATQPKAEISDARITEIAFDFYADSNDGDAMYMVSFARAILAEAGKQE